MFEFICDFRKVGDLFFVLLFCSPKVEKHFFFVLSAMEIGKRCLNSAAIYSPRIPLALQSPNVRFFPLPNVRASEQNKKYASAGLRWVRGGVGFKVRAIYLFSKVQSNGIIPRLLTIKRS
jgi:hypothetical protein